ncbi:MAG: FUSC family protein [Actinobacteria bacterium]|nr:FUSC family protein [Actinomycetota bacterium]MCB8996419.1 FUSC family protein [Actinomycetota bacterium]MCB9425313.1 FUSC family protein [Actinomycetota bacterium]
MGEPGAAHQGSGGRVALLLATAIVPPLLLTGVVFEPGMSIVTFFGIVVGLVTAVMAGPRLAMTSALVITLLGPIAVVVGLVPAAGAALMALACIGVGITAGWGVHKGTAMILLGLSYLLVDPPTIGATPAERLDNAYIAAVLVTLAVGAFWPALIVPRLLAGHDIAKPERNTRADTVEYLAVITTTCTLATWGVLTWAPETNASWLLLTLIVVVQVGPQATISKTVQRVGGTVLGGAVAAGLVALLPHNRLLGLAGLAALVLAMLTATRSRYWLFSSFMTAAIVLLSGADDPTGVDTARVGYTVLGGLIALLAILVSGWIRSGIARRHAKT